MKSRQRLFCHRNSWSRLGPDLVLFMSIDLYDFPIGPRGSFCPEGDRKEIIVA